MLNFILCLLTGIAIVAGVLAVALLCIHFPIVMGVIAALAICWVLGYVVLQPL